VPVVPAQRTPRAAPSNALTVAEQDEIIAVLTSPRFCDKSVAQTWATLLDEGVYLASMSTMHRLLRLIGAAGDRRDQATYPTRARPELMATKPGDVWSWDITKLRGPQRGVYYDLYVILDIYSRYVVGWTVAARESARQHAFLRDALPAAAPPGLAGLLLGTLILALTTREITNRGQASAGRTDRSDGGDMWVRSRTSCVPP